MKLRIKIILCAALVLFAAVSLAAVLGGLGVIPASAVGEESYVLREYDGYVGVFYPAQEEEPTILTDIRVRELPIADRMELAVGIDVTDYSSVVGLLEDFGS